MLAVRATPTIAGNTALGLSSPERPALHIPDPLSMTTAGFSITDTFTKKNYIYLEARFISSIFLRYLYQTRNYNIFLYLFEFNSKL